MYFQLNNKLINNTMGSSRRFSPPPIPYGFGSYEQGTDSSGTGAVMPKGMMPDNYTPQTRQPREGFAPIGQAWNGGTNGVSYGNSYGAFNNISNMTGGNENNKVNALAQGSNYFPFFMKF